MAPRRDVLSSGIRIYSRGVRFYTPLSESLVPFDREDAGRRLHSIRKASEFDKEGVW